MAYHDLKIHPEHFDAVASGAKPYEVRNNDRGYEVGDVLVLHEYNRDVPPGEPGEYTGREVHRAVTHVLRDFVGLQPGYVVLGFGFGS